MSNRIWVDVEDLFQYAIFNGRPSGIQRIEFELCRALALMPETRDRVGFVRHASAQNGFYAIPFAQIDTLHARLTAAPRAAEGAAGSAHGGAGTAVTASHDDAGAAPAARFGGPARRIAYRVPPDLRAPLVNLYKSQRDAVRAVSSLTGATARMVSRLRRPGQAGQAGPAAQDAADGLTVAAFNDSAQPGDVLLVLGSPWFHPFYNDLVARARARWQLRVALLVYDIIPLLRPEWCDRNLVDRFGHWARGILPQADTLLTISQASAQDIVRVAGRQRLALRSAPVAIPVGTGFSAPVGRIEAQPARIDRLPKPGSYALMVSTIEARKNHALLFRIWRRLLDELPAEQVPTLVFAGKVGWLVDDLMQQLRNARHLDGKVVLIEDAQDAELELLYRGCLFTLFPSFYEGWGLPVTESFSFGRPCIISNASALPEAGGTLARYFDPENGSEAYRVIRRAIEEPEETAAWAGRVAAEFRPVSWEESARAMIRTIDQTARRGPVPAMPSGGREQHLV